MAIYKLTYYVHDAPRRLKRRGLSSYVIYEQTFHLKDLTPIIQKRLFKLIPFFDDLSNINLTVDFEKLKEIHDSNLTRFFLEHINDIYYLYGIPIDIESIVVSTGKVGINPLAPEGENRAFIEMPKITVCVPKEVQEFYTFSCYETPNQIIQKAYEYYYELTRYLKVKFDELKLRKEALIHQYKTLKYLEEERLKEFERLEKEVFERYQKEKYAWIAKYGSDHLKFLYNLNYEKECDHVYIQERVAKELEGWDIDFDNRLSYFRCQVPSKNAIKYREWARKQGFESDVVLIKKQKEDIYQGVEAVLIHNYLNRYKLYKQVL